jgi:hypothetical protein
VSAVISFRSETAVAVTSRGMCVCDRTATSPYRTYLTVILVPPKPAVVATVTPQRFGYAGGVFAVELVLVAPVPSPPLRKQKIKSVLAPVRVASEKHAFVLFFYLIVCRCPDMR